jgi:hypothetical protein
MTLNTHDFVRLTIRARVIFALAIAEMLLQELRGDPRYSFAVRAYEAALRWQEQLDVRGDTLVDFLMNERDGGIGAYALRGEPKDTDAAWTTLGNALVYTAWHAYQNNNELMPEGIGDSTEEDIQNLIDEARKGRSYDEKYVQRVYDYLLSNNAIQDGDKLGKPIDMRQVKRSVSSC